ncbi:MAG: FadR family transcriptional regulator [Oscillospiraceae bacterium]|nr:FadR family transcriptional regulator [Oscillospiraceae bacterium]
MNHSEKRNTSQKIVDYLLDQIQSGVLRKGSRLPTEHDLAELLGVSRIPLREAICALRTVGLLEARQGGGTYVTTNCDPAILGRMLYDYALLENVDLHQIVDVRILLEPEAARQAALQGTQLQKEAIMKLSDEYSQVVENYLADPENHSRMASLDREFHQAIAKASHNEFLWMLLVVSGTSFNELNSKSSRSLDAWGARTRKLFSEQHRDIAQAILAGDASQARKIMEKHLRLIKGSLTTHP